MGRRNEKRDITRPTIVLPEPELPPDVWFQQPLPPREWWDERWGLTPENRWMRDAIIAIDETSVRQPIDELALLATHEGDKKAIEEFFENPHARLTGLLRWQALAGAIAFCDELEDAHRAIGLLGTLTTILSSTLDRMEHPRIDPTPLWYVRNAGWEVVTKCLNGRDAESDTELLRQRYLDALPIVDQTKALSQDAARGDDVFVTTEDIAKVVHLSKETLRKHRKQWGPPAIPARGRAPGKWRWSEVRPILHERFPEAKLPESSAALQSRLAERR